jgi:hypothetical protein
MEFNDYREKLGTERVVMLGIKHIVDGMFGVYH